MKTKYKHTHFMVHLKHSTSSLSYRLLGPLSFCKNMNVSSSDVDFILPRCSHWVSFPNNEHHWVVLNTPVFAMFLFLFLILFFKQYLVAWINRELALVRSEEFDVSTPVKMSQLTHQCCNIYMQS